MCVFTITGSGTPVDMPPPSRAPGERGSIVLSGSIPHLLELPAALTSSFPSWGCADACSRLSRRARGGDVTLETAQLRRAEVRAWVGKSALSSLEGIFHEHETGKRRTTTIGRFLLLFFGESWWRVSHGPRIL